MAQQRYPIRRTSLCLVSPKLDRTGKYQLYRVADVEDGVLVELQRTDSGAKMFENREYLFRFDGPSQPGDAGVWDWTAAPNASNPQTDYIDSRFDPDFRPVSVKVLPLAGSLTGVLAALKKGVPGSRYNCDTYFCYEYGGGRYRGLLCRMEELEPVPDGVRLRKEVLTLPRYDMARGDFFVQTDIPNDERINGLAAHRFWRSMRYREPDGYLLTRDINEIICAIFLRRISWRQYRDAKLGTNAEFQRAKAIFGLIYSQTVYDEVAQTLRLSDQKAKEAVEAFVQDASSLLDGGDVDSEALTRLIMSHESLRTRCEQIVEERWLQANQSRQEAADKQLQTLTDQIGEQEAHRKALDEDIAAAQAEIERLQAEAERYRSIGDRAAQGVRDKIQAARQDVGGFLAEVSAFLPADVAPAPMPVSTAGPAPARLLPGGEVVLPAGQKPDIYEDLAETLDNLQTNLQTAFATDPPLARLLAGYLYAVCRRNTQLLLAGPFALELAQVLTRSLYGRMPAILEPGAGLDAGMVETLAASDDPVLVVRSMFQPGWQDGWLPLLAGVRKPVLWLCPFAEELQVEPKGLYSYVLPLFTECFVGKAPDVATIFPGRPAEPDFEPQQPKEERKRRRPATPRNLEKLPVSKLTSARLRTLLTDAARLMVLDSCGDLEYLFAQLPLSVLLGRADALRELLESETNLSAPVRAELERWLGEV